MTRYRWDGDPHRFWDPQNIDPPDAMSDLIVTSPPFLNLRTYLQNPEGQPKDTQ